MLITVVAVGKIKEKFYREAAAEYAKRLSKYCKLNIIEVADEKTPDRASAAEEDNIKEKEAERILKHVKGNAHVIALSINGSRMDSVGFSERIETLGIQGKSHIVFMIGGSLGIHSSLLGTVQEQISFSDMTFPHQLMRVILLEQIYRGYRIMSKEPYHK